MASMKPVLDAQFWNEESQSCRAVDGVVHSLPHHPPPLATHRSSRLLRCQQLLLLQRMFSFPCTPSYSHGGVFLDRVVAKLGGPKWWATLTTRLQTHGLVFPLQQTNEGNDSRPLIVKGWNRAKHVVCHSLRAFGMHTRVVLSPSTSLSASCEVDNVLGRLFSCNAIATNNEKPLHGQATFRHKLQQHEILMEGAWNDTCVDARGQYWNVPQTLSVDVVSAGLSSGIRYRAGVCHSTGVGEPLGQAAIEVPLDALAGTRARIAVSVENQVNLWKGARKTFSKRYNHLASQPHVTVSCIIGGILSANISSRGEAQQEGFSLCNTNRAICLDAFASLGVSAQLGHFQKQFLDFSKVGARLDLGAASRLVRETYYLADSGSSYSAPQTLEVTLQQQVAGPVRARVDSRFAINSHSLQMQDLTCGLDYSLESLRAAKLVFWYSPTRKEGMVEMRILES